MPLCSTCGNKHDRKDQRYCAPCHAAYMREWRKDHPLNDAHRKRDIARSIAGVKKRRGHIERRPCRVCSSPESEMHHPDHEMPRLVVWLCRACHLSWHAHWRALSLQAWQSWLAKSDKQSEAA